ncbi:hypothetical protein [Clostridium cochlearium]|uniref:Uncharacterized protein n=1 Tax=Clostridium cochlearium TaxID=1494 RepID=A0A240A1A7_CLOCO|nr:hypothetical protein [Clostridium cochlearium]MBV1821063.1 hypothetical protein [Bacteroidales bacterium MSK.15.36]NSJ91073.1 hypothetical protein [Coprococcus sp. MSK.21.13]MBE6064433.1 hypothetical protein [Clostridium cochlearium]MBU5269462.1 hypothetical protein [Clostridium cochlearium]MCG4581211.1 hypothetical protein [Clostridium cochlearium]
MRKMDEMEMYISLKSIKIAWFYTIVFLFIWSVYEYITTSKFGLSFFLFITQNLILTVSQFILKHKMGGKNEK